LAIVVVFALMLFFLLVLLVVRRPWLAGLLILGAGTIYDLVSAGPTMSSSAPYHFPTFAFL
jgi:hypothetical protein